MKNAKQVRYSGDVSLSDTFKRLVDTLASLISGKYLEPKKKNS